MACKWSRTESDDSMSINWLAHPKDTNFDAAMSYLILAVGHSVAQKLVDRLHKAAIETFAAKDILRAANTQALPLQTEHVQDNLEKMKKGHEIGPVLLCRVPDRPNHCGRYAPHQCGLVSG